MCYNVKVRKTYNGRRLALDIKDPKKTDELLYELKGLDSRYVDVIKTLVGMLKEKSDYNIL